MIIPYTVFLGIYLLAALFILVYALINLLHVMRLSLLSSQAVAVTFIFIAGLLFIAFMSYHSLVKIDWHGSINVGAAIQDQVKEFNPL
jgi:hypothetical protein